MTIAATIRGYTITGTATLDHYEISVDGGAPTDAGTGHYTFETKGTHTIAISAVWRGTATITGPGLPDALPARRPRTRDDHVDARPTPSTRSAPCSNPDVHGPAATRRYRVGMSLGDARLFHVNVNCSDLERSRRFYTEGLGLEIGAHTAPAETRNPARRSGSIARRWDASILLGPRGYDGGAIDLLEWHEPPPVGLAARAG